MDIWGTISQDACQYQVGHLPLEIENKPGGLCYSGLMLKKDRYAYINNIAEHLKAKMKNQTFSVRYFTDVPYSINEWGLTGPAPSVNHAFL